MPARLLDGTVPQVRDDRADIRKQDMPVTVDVPPVRLVSGQAQTGNDHIDISQQNVVITIHVAHLNHIVDGEGRHLRFPPVIQPPTRQWNGAERPDPIER